MQFVVVIYYAKCHGNLYLCIGVLSGVLQQCLPMAGSQKARCSGAHGIFPWLSWLTLVPLLLSTM